MRMRMRKVGMMAAALVVVWAGMLPACIDPMAPYSAGVVFSNGEVLNLDRIEQAAQDEKSYIKQCTTLTTGRAIVVSDEKGPGLDPLNIERVSVTGNRLSITVSYGGGCKVHAIELYTDKALLKSNPPQMNFFLSHDANGDNCEAMITETIDFDLASPGIVQEMCLRIYAPDAAEPFRYSVIDSTRPFGDLPFWEPVSGNGAQQCSYNLQSAYSPKVMAHIGYFEGFAGSGGDAFRIVLVFDTAAVPTNETKSVAMVAELKRLAAIGVLSMSDSIINRIGAALAGKQGQYWTAQDTVLDFNFWFDGTTVNGVKSVNGVRGCGIGVAYALPDREFIPVSVVGAAPQKRTEQSVLRGFVDKSGIHFRFAPITGSASVLTIIDMRGREVAAMPLAKNATNLTLSGSNRFASRLPAGCYLTAVVDGGRIVQQTVVTVTGH